MRTAGDRFITPLLISSMLLLAAGLQSQAQSSPDSAKDGKGAKATQTRPTQTRPSRSAAPAAHSTAAKKPAASKVREAEKPLVFTDDDLKRYHSGTTASTPRPAAAPTPSEDPLKSLKDQQERARWRQEKTAQLQQKVLDLEGKLKTLEQKRLSVVNPFVPRPQEGEDQKAEEKGLSGQELLARTEAEITQTVQDLESARKELASFLDSVSQ
jgi:hypothetical protein